MIGLGNGLIPGIETTLFTAQLGDEWQGIHLYNFAPGVNTVSIYLVPADVTTPTDAELILKVALNSGESLTTTLFRRGLSLNPGDRIVSDADNNQLATYFLVGIPQIAQGLV